MNHLTNFFLCRIENVHTNRHNILISLKGNSIVTPVIAYSLLRVSSIFSTSGSSLDITNHLLNKPEIFSQPHTKL